MNQSNSTQTSQGDSNSISALLSTLQTSHIIGGVSLFMYPMITSMMLAQKQYNNPEFTTVIGMTALWGVGAGLATRLYQHINNMSKQNASVDLDMQASIITILTLLWEDAKHVWNSIPTLIDDIVGTFNLNDEQKAELNKLQGSVKALMQTAAGFIQNYINEEIIQQYYGYLKSLIMDPALEGGSEQSVLKNDDNYQKKSTLNAYQPSTYTKTYLSNVSQNDQKELTSYYNKTTAEGTKFQQQIVI